MSKLRLAVGIPAYGNHIVGEHAKMWLEFGSILNNSPERFELAGHILVDTNPVDRARNLLIAHAMTHNADWLLMIDADTWVISDMPNAFGVAPDVDAGFMLLRMISEAAHAGATLVSAPVVRRVSHDYDRRELAVYEHAHASPHGLRPLEPENLPMRMVEAYAVGAACLAMDLRKIGDAQFTLKPDLSEDLDFCAQIRALDGKILVDGRVRTGHLSRAFPIYNRD
jgi:hypothetical protein